MFFPATKRSWLTPQSNAGPCLRKPQQQDDMSLGHRSFGSTAPEKSQNPRPMNRLQTLTEVPWKMPFRPRSVGFQYQPGSYEEHRGKTRSDEVILASEKAKQWTSSILNAPIPTIHSCIWVVHICSCPCHFFSKIAAESVVPPARTASWQTTHVAYRRVLACVAGPLMAPWWTFLWSNCLRPICRLVALVIFSRFCGTVLKLNGTRSVRRSKLMGLTFRQFCFTF